MGTRPRLRNVAVCVGGEKGHFAYKVEVGASNNRLFICYSRGGFRSLPLSYPVLIYINGDSCTEKQKKMFRIIFHHLAISGYQCKTVS